MPSQLRSPTPAYVVQRLPTPRCEPPYDDESPDPARRARPGDGVQGTLALSFAHETDRRAPTPGLLHLVPALEGAVGDAGPARSRPAQASTGRAVEPGGKEELDLAARREPLRTGRDELPDPRPWADGFVQALTEVLGGFRPIGQLSRRVRPQRRRLGERLAGGRGGRACAGAAGRAFGSGERTDARGRRGVGDRTAWREMPGPGASPGGPGRSLAVHRSSIG